MSWVQAEVESGQSIGIKKVVESPLPFVINYDNIQKSTTALRIANHLNSLADTNELTTDKLRFVLSTKFGITKKITLDETIAPNLYSEIVKNELSYII
ncbi:MAG: hypothetical protein GWN01_12450, partial [Nitrosopumilaceae archaeon]|nr:hypothetical protein [Nitrosopumilaceae archaeon]NIX62286.1 hypothetical protein [Nitrosopumilaceae archaeon]